MKLSAMIFLNVTVAFFLTTGFLVQVLDLEKPTRCIQKN